MSVNTRSGAALEHLERQARRLQRLFLVLTLIVGLGPGSIYVVLEIKRLHDHAGQDGREIAFVLATQLALSGPDLHALTAKLKAEMEENGLIAMRLSSHGGGRLEFGELGKSFLLHPVTVDLPPSAGPFETLEVEPDERPLLRRTARVFGIHFLVALVLVGVYRAQMRALREALRRARDTFDQLLHSDKLSAIGEMYAGLTHEINNPLGIVLSGVRLLVKSVRERDVPRNELIGELETIDHHSSRIAEITRSLLAFGRRAPFEVRETSLNTVVDDVVALVAGSFAKQDIAIERQCDPSLPRVRASHDHLVQVFVNLVNNSRDAMPTGGTIRLRTYRADGAVVAEVADTGLGITPEIRDRIFEPFFTTKEIGKGTGLGLSVSYGIVQAHGGRIEVASSDGSDGGGAVFRVMLPTGG